MIKFVLILHLCSFTAGHFHCKPDSIKPLEFANWSDCVFTGYKISHNALKETYTEEQINKKKLAVRFACKQVVVQAS